MSRSGIKKGSWVRRATMPGVVGKVVALAKNGYMVRWDGVGDAHEVQASEVVTAKHQPWPRLTLGDLRKFLADNSAAPDDLPVVVDVPVGYWCDDNRRDRPMDHPDVHDRSMGCHVHVSALYISGFSDNDYSVEEWIPPEHRTEEEGDWDFFVEICVNDAECHNHSRDCEEVPT